ECNLALGHLKDDVRLTRAATAYLKRKTLPGRGPPIFGKRRKNRKARLAARTPVTAGKTTARPPAWRPPGGQGGITKEEGPAEQTRAGLRITEGWGAGSLARRCQEARDGAPSFQIKFWSSGSRLRHERVSSIACGCRPGQASPGHFGRARASR